MSSLTDEQRKAHQNAFEADLAAVNTKLEALIASCQSCQQSEAVCSKHVTDARQLLRDLFLNLTPDRWYAQVPEYTTTITKLFDSNAPLKEIWAAILSFFRSYHKTGYTTIRFDDEESVRSEKVDLADRFDQQNDILSIGKALQLIASRNREDKSAEQIAIGEKLAACTTDEARYAFLEDYYTRPQAGDDEDVATVRKKYAAMFAQKVPYEDIRSAMDKDIEDRENEIAKRERLRKDCDRELQNLKMGEAGLKKRRQKKMEQQAAGVAKFLKDNSHPCSGKGCEKTAEPESVTLGPRECRVCFALSQSDESQQRVFYCSKECEDNTEAEHYNREHPCAAGSDCLAKTDTVDRKTGGLCDICEEYFDLKSYFCSMACYEKNKDSHDEKVHGEQKTLLLQKWETDPTLENQWLAQHPEPMAV